MIKTLRWRLVLVMMMLLTVVMLVVAVMFFSFVYEGMEEDSLVALELAGDRYGLHKTHPEGVEIPEQHPPEDILPEEMAPNDNAPDGKGPDGKGPDGKAPDGKEDRKPQEVIPCFVVGYDHEGTLYARGPRYYDLSDEAKLKQLVEQARETGDPHGLLTDHYLRFLRLDGICGEAYAFTDVSSEMDAMIRLIHQVVWICLLALVGFFLISLAVSRWATSPTERVLEQQRQFIADASHELKTPLTVILTNAELVSEGEGSPEEEKRATEHILTMARQMRGLVEELLDLARVNNGIRMEQKAPVDLSRVVEDQVLLFEPVYYEAGRELQSSVEPGIGLMGAEERLRQVVDILLDNGCKYSHPDTVITLKLSRASCKKCLLTVESRGDSLTDQECRDIFQRFYRREAHRSMNHSYGLGLSIARTVVREHRGKIWAESENGVNTFSIRLPLGKKK